MREADYVHGKIATIRQHDPEALRNAWWTGTALALADAVEELEEELKAIRVELVEAVRAGRAERDRRLELEGAIARGDDAVRNLVEPKPATDCTHPEGHFVTDASPYCVVCGENVVAEDPPLAVYDGTKAVDLHDDARGNA